MQTDSKKTIVLTLLVTAAAVCVGYAAVRSQTLRPAAPLVHIELAAENGPLSSPIWIAMHNGYFADVGLDVYVEKFNSGRDCLDRLLQKNGVAIATVAQTPMVSRSFARDDFRVIAGIVHTANDVKIVARKDRNIAVGRDLKGKTLGITLNSSGHYFLSLFLAQQNLTLPDVTILPLNPQTMSDNLQRGTADAIAVWEPHAYRSALALGDNAVTLQSAGVFREDFYLAAMNDWIAENPETTRRFIEAIAKAEAFISKNPNESKRIVSEETGIDLVTLENFWHDYEFRLFLDQAILLSFEQQARWLSAQQGVAAFSVPNYLTFLFFDALELVKPDAITIVR